MSAGGGGELGRSVRGEARWPSVAAVTVAILLTLLRPKELRVAPVWTLPAVEVVLLAVLIVRDPGRIDRRAAVLRGGSVPGGAGGGVGGVFGAGGGRPPLI